MATAPKPDAEGNVQIKMSELTGIITEAIKGMTFPEIEALKQQITDVNRKMIYPSGEGAIFETVGKSIVDTSYFSKSYMTAPTGGMKDGEWLGRQLKSGGGPWLRLSPTMEKFAIIVACGGDPQKAASKGVDINAYNAEVREQYKAALGEKSLTTSDAGAIVPVEYLATVVEFATAQSAILGRVWRIPMSSMVMKIPKLVQAAGSYFGGVLLYHPDEAGIKTESKPSFDTLTFTAKKLIGLISLTDELVGDSSINIINYITGLFTRAFQFKTEGEVISGTGLTNQMTGITADTDINLVPRVTAGTVKFDDLVNMESALDENFNNLSFISRRATVNTFRKQKDTNGQPLYHDGFAPMFGGAIPPQLMGYPVYKTRNCPALGSQGDIILGDLGFYIWAMRQEMTIDSSKDFRFNYDETTLRFVVRQDGAPGVSIAFSILDEHMS